MGRDIGLLGNFAKSFAIMVGAFIIFAIIGFIVSWMTEIAVVLFLMIMIPLSVITFENWKNEKREKTQSHTRATEG